MKDFGIADTRHEQAIRRTSEKNGTKTAPRKVSIKEKA